MAPVNKVKTYSRSNNSIVKNSVNAFNELFAKNMTKRLIGKNRKKHNFLVKELPPRCGTLLADDSLNISTEDTFDKLLKKYKKKDGKCEVDINCSTSKPHKNLRKSKSSLSQTSTFYSPIMTRTRRRCVSITEKTNNHITIPDESKNSSNPYQYLLNAPTINGIDVSLEVEGLPVKPEKSSSYLVLPTNSREPRVEHNTSVTLNNIFTRTFRERQFIHSSTPLASQKSQKKIINHTISPIKNLSCLVKESFEEIKKWDSQFPSVNGSKHCSNNSLITRKTKDKESIENRLAANYEEPFLGFSKLEQSESKRDILDESSQVNHRMSFITLRRRKIPKLDRGKSGEKVKYKCLSNSQLSNDCTVSLNTFNSSEVNMNPSISENIDYTIDLSSNVGKERNMISKSEESQMGEESKINNFKKRSCVVSLDTFDTFEAPNNLSNSQAMNEFHDRELETPLKSTNIRKRLLSVSDSMLHNATQDATNTKRCKSVDSLEFLHKEYDTDFDSVKISKDTMVINLTKYKFNNTELGGFSSCNFENFFSRNEFGNESTKNDTLENTSIISSDHDQKELLVNVTRNDIITSTDFEKFYSQNVSIEKPNCDNKFANHDAKELVVNISRCFSEQVDESKEKILVVNVTQNIFEDFYSKNYISDYNTGASSAMTSSDKEPSASLNANVNRHNSTSLIDISYVEPNEKKSQTTRYSQVEEYQMKNIHNSGNICLGNSIKDISYVDLTDSLNESGKHILPQADVRSQRKSTPDLSDIIESSILESSQKDKFFKVPMVSNTKKVPSKTVLLKAGKSWRRSLSTHKRSSILIGSIKDEKRILENEIIAGPIDQIPKNNRFSIKVIPVQASPIAKFKRNTTILEDYAVRVNGYVPDQTLDGNLENSLRCLSLRRTTNIVQDSLPVSAREVVLRRCGQTEPIPFSECYPQSALHHCQKIGEGVYGEVFLYRNPAGGTSVMKVIPIEGDQIVNGERQKKFEEILSEVVIAMELSNLRNNKKNATSTFSRVQKIHCVQGHYPEKLLDLWELYEESRGSENDCPDFFTNDQLYIVLELENAGGDLEAFLFNNAQQAYSMFKQVAFGLAVAEEELRFEHRDLHWGNILLNAVDRNKAIEFCLNGEKFYVSTRGVQATIIDFTLSRIEHDGVVIFNDLGSDPDLFTAEGDYQFEIYRLMQKKNENNWQGFEPYSNLLWLHYILDKAVTALRYKNAGSKTHKDSLLKMTQLSEGILSYKSVKDFVLNSQF